MKGNIIYFNPINHYLFDTEHVFLQNIPERVIGKNQEILVTQNRVTLRFSHNHDDLTEYVKSLNNGTPRILIYDNLLLDPDKETLRCIENIRETDKNIKIVMSFGSTQSNQFDRKKDIPGLFKETLTPWEFFNKSVDAHFFEHHFFGSGYIEYLAKDKSKNKGFDLGKTKGFIKKLRTLNINFAHVNNLMLLENYSFEGSTTLFSEDIIFSSSLMNYYLTPHKPKLYVITGPSGFGKSTLIDQLDYLGVKIIPKITTRGYRSVQERIDGKIISVQPREFQSMLKRDLILGAHRYNDHLYGLRREDLEFFLAGDDDFVWDTCDLHSAFKIKKENDSNVKLAVIFPGIDVAGMGLEKRIDNIKNPSECFNSFAEELKYLERSEKVIMSSKHRLESTAKESRWFKENLDKFDILLRSGSLHFDILKLIFTMTNPNYSYSEEVKHKENDKSFK